MKVAHLLTKALFAAVPAQGLGLVTALNVGGGASIVNEHADRFLLVRFGKQFRFHGGRSRGQQQSR
jgi:hypothetical protein